MARGTKSLALGGAACVLAGCVAAGGGLTGCKHTNTTMAYGSAINTFYSAHPACLWPDPIKFPVQVDTKNDTKTSGYDALVDQGILLRTTGEKKVFIFGSKEVTNYDLNDRGRSAWTPDSTQPGYGNFCYGHRNVSTIDSSTPTTAQAGATTQLSYHYTISGAPNWALAAETQNAFPELKANLAGESTGTATLVYGSGGWQMQAPPAKAPSASVDGKIAE